jgi:hypothetical protein
VGSVPQIAGFEPTFDFEPFLLPAANAVELHKLLPAKASFPALLNAYVGRGTTKDKAIIALTDLDNDKVLQPRAAAGQFPNLEMVMPPLQNAVLRISVNPSLLIPVLTQMKDFNDNPAKDAVVFSFFGAKPEDSQFRIDAHNEDTGQDMTAVVMPMRYSPEISRSQALSMLRRYEQSVRRIREEFGVNPEGTVLVDAGTVLAVADGYGGSTVKLLSEEGATADARVYETEEEAVAVIRRFHERTLLVGESLQSLRSVVRNVPVEFAGRRHMLLVLKELDDDEAPVRAVLVKDGALEDLSLKAEEIVDVLPYETRQDALAFAERIERGELLLPQEADADGSVLSHAEESAPEPLDEAQAVIAEALDATSEEVEGGDPHVVYDPEMVEEESDDEAEDDPADSGE